MLTRKASKGNRFAEVRRKLVFEGFRQGVNENDHHHHHVADISYPDTSSAFTTSEANSSNHINVDTTNGHGIAMHQSPISCIEASTSYAETVTSKELKDDWNMNSKSFRDPYWTSTDIDVISEKSTDPETNVPFAIFCVCLIIIPLSFLPWTSTFFSSFQIEVANDDSYMLLYDNNPVLCLFGLLISSATAAAISLTCCGFSWTVLYFDSLEPGKNPPTPFSPPKFRKKSGHTFHIGYSLSFINAAMMFVYYLWSSRQSYLR